jgi:hypothetical protein
MAVRKKVIEESILTTTAEAIGSTLGMLAKKVGLATAEMVPAKAPRKAAVRKKVSAQKSAAAKGAPKPKRARLGVRAKEAAARDKNK